MSVEVNPHSQLGFPRPLTELVTRPLTITNTSNESIAFKVKTTAPKQYLVKPNTGMVAPGQKASIAIMMQAMQAEPPINAKCRDKFLVQTAPIPAQLSEVSYADFWPIIEKQDKALIREHKIRVAYLPPQSASVPEEEPEEAAAAATPATPLTPAQLQAENQKLRAQLASKGSRIPSVPLPLVALLLAFVAAAAAAGTWFAIENDLIKF